MVKQALQALQVHQVKQALGTSGTSGETGTSGTSGETGTSGTSGETGTSGTSGTSGETGTSGTSGILTPSEAIYAYDSTGGQSITTTFSTLNIDAEGYNSDSNIFDLTGGVITVNTDIRACINFNATCALPSSTRTSVEAILEVSSDGGSNWNEILGSRIFAYVRSNANNDDNTGGATQIIRQTSSGDKYRVRLKTLTGTASTVVNASTLSIFDIQGGEAGPSGANGSSGTSGISSTSGTSGISGTSGTSGETGTSGTSGVSTTPFPYIGDAVITGSLNISSSIPPALKVEGGSLFETPGVNGSLIISKSTINYPLIGRGDYTGGSQTDQFGMSLEGFQGSLSAFAFFAGGTNIVWRRGTSIGGVGYPFDKFEFNTSNRDIDFIINSDTANNLFFVDAGTSRIGILTGTPTHVLHVVGDTKITSHLEVNGSAIDFTNLPTNDPGVAGRLFTTQSANTGGNLDGQLVVLVSQG